MKLYTRTGDGGKTNVIGGRIDKDDVRVEAYGTIDELNAFVGLALTKLDDERFKDVKEELTKIQHELFDCGADLATVKLHKDHTYKVSQALVDFLEERIDIYTDETPKLERFILPGGSEAAAIIHICRTVTRRAERQITKLFRESEPNNPIILKYVNRLSDYFFAVARVINYRLNVQDVEYVRSKAVFRSRKNEQ